MVRAEASNSFVGRFVFLILAYLFVPECGALDPQPSSQSVLGLDRAELTDTRVVEAMKRVPRAEFIPKPYKQFAKDDSPVPIGEGQTISQPFIVAYMTQEAEVGPNSKVLEIGTGSGYQAAVLSELGAEVFSIEIVQSLAETAQATLSRLGYKKVHLRVGDGFKGWPEAAPFDAILVTAAAPRVPEALSSQLKDGGRLVIPLDTEGGKVQMLSVFTKSGKELKREDKAPVRFVPMVGEVRK